MGASLSRWKAAAFAVSFAFFSCVIGILPSAAQDSVADFYKGNTLTVEVGAPPGGVLDLHARLVSRHFAKHIPGLPTLRVVYKPGAGSKVAARGLYAVAPRDGTWITMTFPSAIVDPLLEIKGLDYDPTKFQYIGSGSDEVPICMARRDGPIDRASDLISKELIISATGPGGTNHDFPTAMAGLLGAKFKIIRGYAGGAQLGLAIERKEVQGVCGSWSFTKAQHPGILDGKLFIKIIVQGSMEGDPELNKAGIPVAQTLATNSIDRQALRLFLARYAFATPYMLPPDTPAERVAAMRKAFAATMMDPELIAEAKRINTDIKLTTGEAVQTLVTNIYESPEPIIERLRAGLSGK